MCLNSVGQEKRKSWRPARWAVRPAGRLTECLCSKRCMLRRRRRRQRRRSLPPSFVRPPPPPALSIQKRSIKINGKLQLSRRQVAPRPAFHVESERTFLNAALSLAEGVIEVWRAPRGPAGVAGRERKMARECSAVNWGGVKRLVLFTPHTRHVLKMNGSRSL
jgi:hypothetical protein